ncbi:MAG: chromate transporter [Alphaproteobacteria bacterium]|nr:chromate transporter [Alphaproteobacteria bacterium]
MIYLLLFAEFFKIGALAFGGGMVTVPFLIELSKTKNWFSLEQLADMIAISESTPGPIGINMATFAGFVTSGVFGSLVATFGLVLPAFLVLLLFSKYIIKYKDTSVFNNFLSGIRPAALALILYAGIVIAKLSIVDLKTGLFALLFFILIYFCKFSPIVFIVLGAICGVIFEI